jgi:hypothetical protein
MQTDITERNSPTIAKTAEPKLAKTCDLKSLTSLSICYIQEKNPGYFLTENATIFVINIVVFV